MPTPFFERAEVFQLTDFSSGWSASGTTAARVFNIFPGLLVIRTGLTRAAAADATIGITAFSPADGRRGTITFGAHSDWEPQVIGRIGHVVVGAHVTSGIMKGWVYFQAWA